ncbi:MAG: cytidine deaminase [Armatimonadia bacterium]|nr:cytidine deaminase [Armatimonadia bacterium]
MTTLTPMESELADRARGALQNAHAPHSGLRVGAAVLDEGDRVHVGCNVESDSYGLTLCAERAAIAAMVVAGGKRVKALTVVCDGDMLPWPCGACRQVLSEFADDCPVVVERLTGEAGRATLAQLAPPAFRFALEDGG